MKSKSIYSLMLCILGLAINFNIQIFAQTTVIKGKILDVNGNPSKYAQVGTAPTEREFGKDFKNCDENGDYLISMTNPGLNFLLFKMPSHYAWIIPIINNKDHELKIDVQLNSHKYKDNFDNVGVQGSFNNYNIVSPDKMIKGADGIYRLEVKSDEKEIRYKLCGIEKNDQIINAPGSYKYFSDNQGSYFSVANVVDGKAILEFDPSKLLKKEASVKVTFNEGKSDEKIYNLYREYSKVFSNVGQKYNIYSQTQKNAPAFQYEGGNYLNELLGRIEDEEDQQIKDILKLCYISFSIFNPVQYNNEKAKSFFESISPENPAWGLIPNAFTCYHVFIPRWKFDDWINSFLQKSKSNSLKIKIISDKLYLAKNSNNEEEIIKIHKLLETEYKDNEDAQKLLKRYPIKSRIQIGAEIPEFEFTSISNPAEKYSNKSMLGKIYMIDFWATWCGPCVGEMEVLHKAYEKFKDKGFEILSLSLDYLPETVAKFRNEKWKMPWRNSFISSQEVNKMRETFEVSGIPKPILVSAEGKILEVEEGLRGDELEKTLSKYFN